MKSFILFSVVLWMPFRLPAGEVWSRLFNGRDLTGWVNVNCAPETWTVRGDTVHCTGFPTGALRTERMYENFVLELEWRHLEPGGNAGIFVWAGPIGAPGVPFLRAVEVQVLDHGYITPYLDKSYTTHGDVFPIHGSTMNPFPPSRGQRSFPSERHGKASPEWNRYRIEARDGTLWLWVNGHRVSGGSECDWRKGYLALESEGAPVEFRNVRLRELPAGQATAQQTASAAEGHRSLYTGTDLRGWRTVGAVPSRWRARDWRLQHEAGQGSDGLVSEMMFGDVELIVDCQPDDAAASDGELVLRGAVVPLSLLQPGGPVEAAVLKRANRGFHRLIIRLRGRNLTVQVNGTRVLSREVETTGNRGPIALNGGAQGFALSGLYVRELN